MLTTPASSALERAMVVAEDIAGVVSVRERNRQRIRSAIVRAAMASFAAHGVGDTTIERIAAEAGIARATVFKHFANKNAIITAVVEQMDFDLLQQVERHACKPVPAHERIAGFMAENGALLESRGDVIRPLVQILEQGWNELPGEARMQRLRRAFVQLAGGPEQRADAEPLAEVVLGAYLVITHNWRVTADYAISEHLLAAARLIGGGLRDNPKKS